MGKRGRLFSHKNAFTLPVVSVLAFAWFMSVASGSYVVSQAVTPYQDYVASIPMVTQVHEVEEFNGVDIRSNDSVEIKKGDTYMVEFSGKENDVANRIFKVHNGVLVINNDHKNVFCIGCALSKTDIVITTPTLQSLRATHSVKIKTDTFTTDTFDATFIHSAYGDLQVIAEHVRLLVSHSSEVVLEGSVKELVADVKYSSEIDTTDLINEKTAVEVSHSSEAHIRKTDVLNARARHSSDIYYDGDPELTEDASNSSEIKKRF